MNVRETLRAATARSAPQFEFSGPPKRARDEPAEEAFDFNDGDVVRVRPNADSLVGTRPWIALSMNATRGQVGVVKGIGIHEGSPQAWVQFNNGRQEFAYSFNWLVFLMSAQERESLG